ncbi:GNAT family N-acetyltransferase [Aquimarina mytili]|uniref:GNAT family N-acetyltransferase n=1 Tax=Aquimarina mytili TaxID=874423 RepID=A0A937D5A1_9FLAO|nr:GNAT family N-acetyltransferase [Aquimarina mytili]MBL0683079.1 GNAT family N-acetyltransferase [Aquimarina mytili]
MNSLEISNTQRTDAPFIYFLFEEAISYQKRNHYPVWKGYDKIAIESDIENRLQFKIMINTEIACVFSICYSDALIWRERDNGNSVYLHRVVVNPKFKGRKLFGEIVKWVKNHAKEKRLKHIRMDTWVDNPTIIKYYKGFGFKVIDYYTTPDNIELPIPQRNNFVVLLQYEL